MSACIRHPHQSGSWYCQKYQVNLCDACRRCRDPELYCRYRSACSIHFLEKTVDRFELSLADRPSDG
jgi:hypothetical protein